MKIVLGGSRKITNLPTSVAKCVQELVDSGAEFLVGDAPGIDTSFQKFLQSLDSQNVTVYSSAGYVRNNLGGWKTVEVETSIKSKSSDLHAFKDREMCKLADYGLMVWDSESAGTLSNVLDLINNGKECLVFNSAESNIDLMKFDNIDSLQDWCAQFPEVTIEAKKRLMRFSKRASKSSTEDTAQESLF